MRTYILVLTFLWMSTASILAAEKPASSLDDVTRRLSTGEPTRIVCFGDSITGVYYHTGGQRAWCDMLGFALQKAFPQADTNMINAGISGHTTVNALARIERDVISKQPHLVVVMFGMNDVKRVPLEQFRDNTEAIARRCLDAGAAVVLCTPNSVYENETRPHARLAEFSEAVRQVAAELDLPLVDCFQAWCDQRRQDETAWMLMMSETIHPNMMGHRRFAELIVERISGQDISLDDIAPPPDAMRHTFDRLQANQPVRLVAMPPYDERFPTILRKHFPEAEFQIITWPIEGQSASQLAEWAKQIRGMKPDLVVPAVRTDTPSSDTEDYIRSYGWVLNWSFQFAGRPWDVVPVLPSGPTQDGRKLDRSEELARQIAIGKDVCFVDGDAALESWIADQKQVWDESRRE